MLIGINTGYIVPSPASFLRNGLPSRNATNEAPFVIVCWADYCQYSTQNPGTATTTNGEGDQYRHVCAVSDVAGSVFRAYFPATFGSATYGEAPFDNDYQTVTNRTHKIWAAVEMNGVNKGSFKFGNTLSVFTNATSPFYCFSNVTTMSATLGVGDTLALRTSFLQSGAATRLIQTSFTDQYLAGTGGGHQIGFGGGPETTGAGTGGGLGNDAGRYIPLVFMQTATTGWRRVLMYGNSRVAEGSYNVYDVVDGLNYPFAQGRSKGPSRAFQQKSIRGLNMANAGDTGRWLLQNPQELDAGAQFMGRKALAEVGSWTDAFYGEQINSIANSVYGNIPANVIYGLQEEVNNFIYRMIGLGVKYIHLETCCNSTTWTGGGTAWDITLSQAAFAAAQTNLTVGGNNVWTTMLQPFNQWLRGIAGTFQVGTQSVQVIVHDPVSLLQDTNGKWMWLPAGVNGVINKWSSTYDGTHCTQAGEAVRQSVIFTKIP
jgi:hypothetical protein